MVTQKVLRVAGAGRKGRGGRRAAAPKALKEDSDDEYGGETDVERDSSDEEPSPLGGAGKAAQQKQPRKKVAAVGKRIKDADSSKGKSVASSKKKQGKSGFGNAKPAALAPARQALPPREECAPSHNPYADVIGSRLALEAWIYCKYARLSASAELGL